jgi:UbiD family decarboxylase
LPDLRNFVKELEDKGDLHRISEEVDVYLEAAAIIGQLDNGPAVLMEKIKGYENPIVAGVCGTRSKLCQAIGASKEELHKKLLQAIRNPVYPEIKDRGLVKKNISLPKLSELPVLTHFQKDGGPYITSAIIAARSLDGKIENVSFHRLQILDDTHLAIRIVRRHLYKILQMHKEANKPLEVAISLGLHPSIMLAAASSLPYGVSEYGVANTLLGGDLALTKCEDVSIPVPSDAELVLEGKIYPNQEVEEGPFVDATGTYDIIRKQPVIEITQMMHRDDFIYQALLPGMSEHHLLMGLPPEAQIWESVGNAVPYVRGVNLTLGGCSWLHAIISLEKQSEGDGKSAILAAFAAHKSLKHAVVVDSDIDPHDLKEVEWAIATRFQADKDLLIIPNARGSSLDPSGNQSLGLTTKMGIDATRTLSRSEESFIKARFSELSENRAKEILRKMTKRSND